jgi:glutamine cyclotransferase
MIGCNTDNKNTKKKASPRIKNVVKTEHPNSGSKFNVGDNIKFKFSSRKEDTSIDSIEVLINSKAIIAKSKGDSVDWNTANFPCGQLNLTAFIYLNNGNTERKRLRLNLLSDIAPIEYTYRIINSYPHDTQAYTQGLLVDNGILYESTGQKGESSLRTVDLTSGKTKKILDIPSQYFGEGITILNDDIYYLTYQSRQGFVFDKNTFEEKWRFSYQSEGWGLTTMEDTLVMSDGSSTLTYFDPKNFSEYKKIQVADQNGFIDALNELEYINGTIYANRYQSQLIYLIDPNNGKVKGTLDLTGIIDPRDYHHQLDVLNGIAYDSDKDSYYITGKWWPLLFEIKLISKNN